MDRDDDCKRTTNSIEVFDIDECVRLHMDIGDFIPMPGDVLQEHNASYKVLYRCLYVPSHTVQVFVREEK